MGAPYVSLFRHPKLQAGIMHQTEPLDFTGSREFLEADS